MVNLSFGTAATEPSQALSRKQPIPIKYWRRFFLEDLFYYLKGRATETGGGGGDPSSMAHSTNGHNNGWGLSQARDVNKGLIYTERASCERTHKGQCSILQLFTVGSPGAGVQGRRSHGPGEARCGAGWPLAPLQGQAGGNKAGSVADSPHWPRLARASGARGPPVQPTMAASQGRLQGGGERVLAG